MATPTEQTQITSTIPKYAEPYAQYLLGSTFGGVDPVTGEFRPGLISQGYVPYAGQTVAGFNPLQQMAFEALTGMRTSPQLDTASGLAALAGQRAAELGQYSPAAVQQLYQSPQFREMAASYERIAAPGATQFQMTPAERVGAERFGLGAMQEYMSPYMQGVVERQKRAAVQDFRRQLPGIGAASARVGGRGGTREALLESEARRGLSERMGDIEAQGLQAAYQQAAQQFGADRAAQMQAALANQAAGMQTGQTNLQALINQAQFGAGQGLQSQQLNQAAQLQAQQQMLAQLAQANQFAQQNAAQQAQYGLAGTQLGEQSRQFGAGLGLQGLQQQLAAAGQLGGLGQQQFGQQMGILQGQMGAGGQMQAMEQQLLNQQLQDFINKQQFPYKQAEFGMGILRGIPATGQTSTLYQQPGSLFQQIAGVGLGLGSLFGGLGGGKP
jgi:hypothetical protein